jgi:hypothetical protein
MCQHVAIAAIQSSQSDIEEAEAYGKSVAEHIIQSQERVVYK